MFHPNYGNTTDLVWLEYEAVVICIHEASKLSKRKTDGMDWLLQQCSPFWRQTQNEISCSVTDGQWQKNQIWNTEDKDLESVALSWKTGCQIGRWTNNLGKREALHFQARKDISMYTQSGDYAGFRTSP